MPGYKVFLQDGGDIREGLTCSYCKLVLKDPVQTSESGQRLCRGCFEKASKDPSFKDELEPNDEVWPDSAVKREIANLKVKCENYMVGCDWKGLFKQLMQHSQECQYVTVECKNPGCGQKVPLAKMDEHLKECPQRRVNCKDCGKEMCFIELQEHATECPNAPKACKNCKKKIPASKLADHMIHECKHIRCVCKNDGKPYEAGSKRFHDHLQDVSKLADHLGPMICEFTKMSEAFKEMTLAYQLATKRIDTLEKGQQEDAQRIEMLEKGLQEDTRRIEMLEKRNNELEMTTAKQASNKTEVIEVKCDDLKKKNNVLEKKVEDLDRKCSNLSEALAQKVSSMAIVPKGPGFTETSFQQLEKEVKEFKELFNAHGHGMQLEQEASQRIGSLEKHLRYLSNEVQDISKNNSQLSDEIDNLKRQYTVSIPSSKVSAFGNEMVPYAKPSGEVKQLEEKVLEVERTLNVISVHHSELELQLQASLASTHNGAFLWRIPEVRRRIRDAKIGRITSIYSPPFYTGRNGYKMCIRAYLNGDGTGEGTHLSIFFVLMKGEYDPLLQWPFESKVSLILVDQDHMKHLVQTFKPNAQSSSFQKPKTDMNVASGCPEFADLSILENTSYVKDDVMYIKAIVDTSKIFHP